MTNAHNGEAMMMDAHADIADERGVTRILLHNRQLVTMDSAHVAEFAERIRRVTAHGLACIADKRAARATAQRHISHCNEYAEIAAQVHAATNDDPDPHGDLSWRDEMGLPY